MNNKTTEELLQLAKNLEAEYGKVQGKMQTLYQYMSRLAAKYGKVKQELSRRGVPINNNQTTSTNHGT